MGSEPPPQNPSGYENQDLPRQPEFSVEEQGVLYWLVRGKRDSEIATLRDAKPRTTEKHVGKILKKYDAETRSAAIAAYFEIEMAHLQHDLEIVRAENAKMKLQLAQIRRALDAGESGTTDSPAA